MTIFGTRPEAIKMAPLVKALEQEKCSSQLLLLQHSREMLDSVLSTFEIKTKIRFEYYEIRTDTF